MNRFYQLLLTAVLSAVSTWNSTAQVQFSISPKSQNANANAQVSFAVKVTNFTNIEGYQYTYAFDPAKLEFVGFGPDTSNPTYLPAGGGTTPGVSTQLLAAGKITILWGTPDGLPKSLPDNSTTMTLVFKSLVTGSVGIGFSDTPLAPEVFGPGVDNLPSGTSPYVFDPLINTIGGGGNPCSPDVTPPAFGSCQNISLTTATTCATATWTAPQATDACGTTTVAQISGPASGTCVPIGSSTVVYRATDAAGNTATCSFAITVTKETTVDCTNTWTFPTGIGTDLTLVLSEETVAKADDQVCVRVMVGNFNLIQGLSFSVNWNTANLQYLGIKDDKINFTGATVAANINALQKDNGKLGFFWDDPSGQGVTKANGDVLFEICFKKIGNADGIVSFSDSPTQISGAKEINGQSTDIAIINTKSGKVSICSNNPPPLPCVQPTYDKLLNIKNVTISANGEVCVDVVVKDFKNIEGLQFAITWDNVKLQYQRTESRAAIVELGNNFAFILPNRLNFALDWSSNPLSVDDGKALFTICFQAVGGLGSTAAITFTGGNEVTKNGAPQENVPLGDGSVNVRIPPVVTATNSGLCAGAGTATADIATPGNYTYQWSGPGGAKTGKTITVNAEGLYKVTAVDNASCLTGTAETTVVASSAPSISSLVQNEIGLVMNASSSFVSWATAANPTAVVATGATFTSPQAGVEYIATVGVGACTVTKNILAIGVDNAAPTSLKCAGNANGSVALTISGAGSSTLSYKWSPGGQTTKDLNGIAPGTYIVTISSSDNKVNTVRTFTITSPPALAFTPAPVVKNAPNGSIDIEVTGGTGTVTYQWTGVGNVPTYVWPTPPPFSGSTSQDISGLEPGTYTVVVKDANDCTATTTQKIDVQPIVVKLKGNSVTHTTCGQNNGAAELIATGGSSLYNFTWSGPTQVPNGSVAANLATGEYKISVSDQKYNLTTTFSIFINPSDGPIISVSQVTDAGDNCKGVIDLSVTGGTGPYTYKWSGPTTSIPDVQDPTGLCEGSYTVTLTDAKGCTSVKSGIIVARSARPCPIVNRLVQPNCSDSNDGIIELLVPGGTAPYTYKWTKNGSPIALTGKDLNNVSEGQYSVTVTDATGASCSRDNILLAAKNVLVLSVVTTDPSPNTAKNGAAVLTVSGGSGDYSYKWSGNVSTGSSATGLRAGSYTVTVSDNASGCQVIRTFQLSQSSSMEIAIRSFFNGVNVRCFGNCNGIAEVKNVFDATPPLRYRWSNGDTSRIAKGLCAGVQRVTVTDANNEKFEGLVTIVGPEKLTTNVVIDAVGKSAEAVVTGGTSPYFYRWHDDMTTSKLINLPVGRVFVNVTDANGCESFADGFLGDPGNLDCLKATPVITPNGDGYNDEFEVYCLEKYIQSGKIYNTLEIFNRWGQQVFSKQNYENRTWLGQDIKGNPLPDGPYYYVVEVLLDSGKYMRYKGSFSIISGE